MKKTIFLPLLLLLILTGCYDKGSKEEEQKINIPEQPLITNKEDGASKEFSLRAEKWSFEPSVITVNKDDLVKLKIKSIDVKHGISIPAFNIESDLNPNEETIIEFKATESGTFTFSCSVQCGLGHNNMKGVLIVK